MNTTDAPTRQNLIGLSAQEISKLFPEWPSFRTRQLYEGIYQKGYRSFDEFTTLPKALREELTTGCTLRPLGITNVQTATDGTQKWLFRMDDNREMETVHIPEKRRGTVCVSSQVGCTLTCTFCHTGTQTLVRNLTAGEILSQIITAKDIFNDWARPKNQQHVSHIVFMGMGEPLYNYDNVAKAIQIALDPKGLGFSNRKITLSTSGVVPFIKKCGEELGVNLAISLHAPTNDLRSQIVPLNKKYPLEELMAACKAYPGVHSFRKITFEYVMLKGVNDSPEQARQLIKLVEGLPCKFNLIPFNPWPGAPYECSSRATQSKFANILQRAGITATIRRTRGDDILAACGQLKSKSERERKSKQQPQV